MVIAEERNPSSGKSKNHAADGERGNDEEREHATTDEQRNKSEPRENASEGDETIAVQQMMKVKQTQIQQNPEKSVTFSM
mmetsp:Transcript_6122/g.8050  ORF Transcript_6122/g.8050 Transcript_6122/m.8050 type:complete len:80 (-) Transcript_6122:72-311(-)